MRATFIFVALFVVCSLVQFSHALFDDHDDDNSLLTALQHNGKRSSEASACAHCQAKCANANCEDPRIARLVSMAMALKRSTMQLVKEAERDERRSTAVMRSMLMIRRRQKQVGYIINRGVGSIKRWANRKLKRLGVPMHCPYGRKRIQMGKRCAKNYVCTMLKNVPTCVWKRPKPTPNPRYHCKHHNRWVKMGKWCTPYSHCIRLNSRNICIPRPRWGYCRINNKVGYGFVKFGNSCGDRAQCVLYKGKMKCIKRVGKYAKMCSVSKKRRGIWGQKYVPVGSDCYFNAVCKREKGINFCTRKERLCVTHKNGKKKHHKLGASCGGKLVCQKYKKNQQYCSPKVKRDLKTNCVRIWRGVLKYTSKVGQKCGRRLYCQKTKRDAQCMQRQPVCPKCPKGQDPVCNYNAKMARCVKKPVCKKNMVYHKCYRGCGGYTCTSGGFLVRRKCRRKSGFYCAPFCKCRYGQYFDQVTKKCISKVACTARRFRYKCFTVKCAQGQKCIAYHGKPRCYTIDRSRKTHCLQYGKGRRWYIKHGNECLKKGFFCLKFKKHLTCRPKKLNSLQCYLSHSPLLTAYNLGQKGASRTTCKLSNGVAKWIKDKKFCPKCKNGLMATCNYNKSLTGCYKRPACNTSTGKQIRCLFASCLATCNKYGPMRRRCRWRRKCRPTCACPKNQIWDSVSKKCIAKKSCNARIKRSCSQIKCSKGSFCRKTRRKVFCQKNLKCNAKANQKMFKCVRNTNCLRSCGRNGVNPPRPCAYRRTCGPACLCKGGYIQDDVTRKCIKYSECRARSAAICKRKRCGNGCRCRVRYGRARCVKRSCFLHCWAGAKCAFKSNIPYCKRQ